MNYLMNLINDFVNYNKRYINMVEQHIDSNMGCIFDSEE
jgi:hypothetical protein